MVGTCVTLTDGTLVGVGTFTGRLDREGAFVGTLIVIGTISKDVMENTGDLEGRLLCKVGNLLVDGNPVGRLVCVGFVVGITGSVVGITVGILVGRLDRVSSVVGILVGLLECVAVTVGNTVTVGDTVEGFVVGILVGNSVLLGSGGSTDLKGLNDG